MALRISKVRRAVIRERQLTEDKIALFKEQLHQANLRALDQQKVIDNLRQREWALLNYIQRTRDDPARSHT